MTQTGTKYVIQPSKGGILGSGLCKNGKTKQKQKCHIYSF